jgi:hypothetical protein
MHAENPENFAAQGPKIQPEVFRKSNGIFSGFLGALRAQILQCVGTGSWLSERCMHGADP